MLTITKPESAFTSKSMQGERLSKESVFRWVKGQLTTIDAELLLQPDRISRFSLERKRDLLFQFSKRFNLDLTKYERDM